MFSILYIYGLLFINDNLFAIYNQLIIYIYIFFFYNFTNITVKVFWFTQEVWDDWDYDFELIEWKLQFFLWEACVSGLSDTFWKKSDNFWGDCFFPLDNWLYPEFRYFFIYTDDIVDYWV
jgi:hypothetical protein